MKNILFSVVVITAAMIYGCKSDFNKEVPQQTKSLTILWAKWKPADYLQELTNDFTDQTGIKVNIVQDSWNSWQELFFKEMEKKGDAKFDMVVGDSQWLGKGATEGHYIELTKWMAQQNAAESMTAASITGYSEFPKGSGRYWAIPVEGDAMGFSYRKDLFENPKERENFRKKYKYDLDVPQTWKQLKDIAEFFYRPQEDFYGVLAWQEPKYDGLTMGLDALIWAWGANLGDQKTYRVNGILNTPESTAALEFYKELNKYNNPKWVNYYLDTNSSSNQAMMSGKVAMAMGYFAISPELLDKTKNLYADKIGFFACPAGPKARAASLGGQGISIVSYSKKKDAAFKFLKWFLKDETQKKWAQLGGLSCNKTVLSSDEFLNASPFNKPFVESMKMVRDFWAVPQYAELLKISQKYWSQYLTTEEKTAKETMDIVATEWEKIFEYAGYYKE